MKKRTFLLFEVLIGLILLQLFLIPLLRRPFAAYKSEISSLEEMEGERLADWAFTEVKEKLLNHEIRWEDLPSKEKRNKGPFPLFPSVKTSIPGVASKEIARSFSLHLRREKRGPAGAIYRLLEVKIHFKTPLMKKRTETGGKRKKKREYAYSLLVEYLPMQRSEEEQAPKN